MHISGVFVCWFFCSVWLVVLGIWCVLCCVVFKACRWLCLRVVICCVIVGRWCCWCFRILICFLFFREKKNTCVCVCVFCVSVNCCYFGLFDLYVAFALFLWIVCLDCGCVRFVVVVCVWLCLFDCVLFCFLFSLCLLIAVVMIVHLCNLMSWMIAWNH